MSDPDPAWLAELFEFLRIPSISADRTHAADVREAGEWLCRFVQEAGGECALVETSNQPLVVGEIAGSSGSAAEHAPTVLLYGHFDVQPPGPLEAWDSSPFDPEVRDGWIYGRGSADDKGNLYLLLKAVSLLAKEGRLPVHVRIVCDGEEEILGDSIVRFLAEDERGADACLIFDGPMPRRGSPAFNLGSRGLIYFHVQVRTGDRDLHSGHFGGVALNAAHVLTQMIANVIAMPSELLAGAATPTAEELASWSKLDAGSEMLARQGASPRDADAAENFYVRKFATPSVDVNGFLSGEAILQKTVLPTEATANISIRLAPGQRIDEIRRVMERLLREAAPPGAEVTLECWSSTAPALLQQESPALQLASEGFTRALGKPPLLARTGGTIPILSALAEKGIPTILSGFDVPEGNVHGPNERLVLEYIPVGVLTAREMILSLGELEV